MQAHFFVLSYHISIIGFLAAFKIACSTNRLDEGVAMWVLLFFVKNALALSLNNRVFAATNLAQAVASLQLTEPL